MVYKFPFLRVFIAQVETKFYLHYWLGLRLRFLLDRLSNLIVLSTKDNLPVKLIKLHIDQIIYHCDLTN